MSRGELPMDVQDIPTEKKISARACNVFNELRLAEKLCDVTLVCDDGTKFPVHRAIMASASDFFKALLTSDFTEVNKTEIAIKGVDSDMMKSCMEWVYLRETNINEDNVQRLLPVADYLSILSLLAECVQFLIEQVTFENCIGIRKFAICYFCKKLEKSASMFLLRNFSEVRKSSEELLELSLEEITEILHDDLLNVKSEETVFETAIAWIDYDVEARKAFIFQLLRTVRLGMLSTQYFVEKVKSHAYIKDSDECKPLIIDTFKFLYDLDMNEQKEVDLSNPLSRPRVPDEMIVAIGGWSGGNPTAVVETYDTRADRWISCDVIDGPRAYHGCASIDRKVYLIGGFDGMEYFNSVRVFDPLAKTWEERAPMHSLRCYVSVAVLNSNIYAMGGYNGHVRQNTAERYCPYTNQWTMIQPMNAQRSDASATNLYGRVYICGGFNGEECLSTVEFYDPITDAWTTVAPMRNRRSGVSVIAHKDYAYAVGGFNGSTRMNSGERYNPQTNQWTSITEMYNPRSNFAIEVLDDMIFAIGGFNGVTTIFNVECYDPVVEEWYDATDMNIFRSALSACLISGLSNMEDYLHKRRDQIPRQTRHSTNAHNIQSALLPITATIPIASMAAIAYNIDEDDLDDDDDDGIFEF